MVHSRYTHRSSALPEGPLGCLPSLALTTKGSWIHLLGEGRQASRQLSDAHRTPVNS